MKSDFVCCLLSFIFTSAFLLYHQSASSAVHTGLVFKFPSKYLENRLKIQRNCWFLYKNDYMMNYFLKFDLERNYWFTLCHLIYLLDLISI